MNTTSNRRQRAPSGSGTEFLSADGPSVNRREPELERFKRRLLRELLNQNTNPELTAPLRRAANEAAALAWLTPYPLLVFPALLEEKVQRARQQNLRQARIRQRSRKLLPAVEI